MVCVCGGGGGGGGGGLIHAAPYGQEIMVMRTAL